jgi:hypothetical protein
MTWLSAVHQDYGAIAQRRAHALADSTTPISNL